jgi:hypothetical protein
LRMTKRARRSLQSSQEGLETKSTMGFKKQNSRMSNISVRRKRIAKMQGSMKTLRNIRMRDIERPM